MKVKAILFSTAFVCSSVALTAQQWTGTNPIYYNGGNVGIGTSSPLHRLHLSGTGSVLTRIESLGDSHTGIELTTNGKLWQISKRQAIEGDALSIFYNNGTSFVYPAYFTIHSSGNVGIGTASVGDANYKLFVATGIRTRKVRVDMDTWPDYVFSSTYKRLSILELEQYIEENSHLPGVPSATEIQTSGLDLGEGQKVLMEKVEEMALYIIELKKEIDELKKGAQKGIE